MFFVFVFNYRPGVASHHRPYCLPVSHFLMLCVTGALENFSLVKKGD